MLACDDQIQDSLEGKAVCCFRMPDGSGSGFACALLLPWLAGAIDVLLMNRSYVLYSSGAKNSRAGVLVMFCL